MILISSEDAWESWNRYCEDDKNYCYTVEDDAAQNLVLIANQNWKTELYNSDNSFSIKNKVWCVCHWYCLFITEINTEVAFNFALQCCRCWRMLTEFEEFWKSIDKTE